MSRLRVAPVVEGHGEFQCVRILIERLWREVGGEYAEVLKPVRWPRGRLSKVSGVGEAVSLAWGKLQLESTAFDSELVLILFDSDGECPARLGPETLEAARRAVPVADVVCVLAVVEFETWFAASAESLAAYLEFPAGFRASESPEEARHGKAWIERYFRGNRYSPAHDQPRLTQAMDLSLCRSRSRSFDKLWRELERRVAGALE